MKYTALALLLAAFTASACATLDEGSTSGDSRRESPKLHYYPPPQLG